MGGSMTSERSLSLPDVTAPVLVKMFGGGER